MCDSALVRYQSTSFDRAQNICSMATSYGFPNLLGPAVIGCFPVHRLLRASCSCSYPLLRPACCPLRLTRLNRVPSHRSSATSSPMAPLPHAHRHLCGHFPTNLCPRHRLTEYVILLPYFFVAVCKLRHYFNRTAAHCHPSSLAVIPRRNLLALSIRRYICGDFRSICIPVLSFASPQRNSAILPAVRQCRTIPMLRNFLLSVASSASSS
jgi:hypothetical protein